MTFLLVPYISSTVVALYMFFIWVILWNWGQLHKRSYSECIHLARSLLLSFQTIRIRTGKNYRHILIYNIILYIFNYYTNLQIFYDALYAMYSDIRRAGTERELASRADQRVLRWFGHVERMDECRMGRRVLMAEVSGGRVRGRPRLGWMDGVKVALRNRWMTVEAARQWKIRKSGEPWYICYWMSFTRPFLVGTVFFRTALPCSGGYHLECRYMMRLG